MPPEASNRKGPDPNDFKRLEHMLRCVRDARAIVGQDTAAIIASDMVRSRALVNCFTEIGEAAARLSPEARERVGDVPWRQIVGMRNIIVHMYWGIDLNQLVATVHTDLPMLVPALEAAIRQRPQS